MRRFHPLAVFLAVATVFGCKAPGASGPVVPGTLFIRQQICDLSDFKKAFLIPGRLKARGFTAYNISRDLKDPKTYIITLRCADLQRGADYIRSSNFMVACVGAGLGGIPLLWAGADVKPGEDISPGTAGKGLVVLRCEGRGDDGIWEKTLEGKGRLYRLPGSPPGIILSYETADPFLASDTLKTAQKAAGVTRVEGWYGTNLEAGTF